MANIHVLGISGAGPVAYALTGFGHDPSACLVRDGEIVACAEEERFTRVKHARGIFPYRAIKFCLDQGKIGIEDVDLITGFWMPDLIYKTPTFRNQVFTNPSLSARTYLATKIAKKKYLDHVAAIPYFLDVAPSEKNQVLRKFKFTEHHIAHLASAYYCSGFERAALLSIDNAGENVTTVLGEGVNGAIGKLKESYNPHSAGAFYSAFTQYLGFEPDDAEYKVMGLAPYGKPRYDVDDLLKTSDGTIRVDARIFGSQYLYSEYVDKRFGPHRKRGEKIDDRFADVAYAIQKRLERVSEELAKYIVDKTGNKALGVSGGVGLNTKMNGNLLKSGIVEDIFVQPAANDAGTSVGAALYQYQQMGYKVKFKMEHAYYGPEFSDEYVENWLRISKLRYESLGDISGTVGELVSKGKIVGWFQGRMEFGPRALGNRSILADPRDPGMKDRINEYVKFREEFRPFCPSLLDEAKEEYLQNAHDSPFMILTFDVPREKQKEIPAVVHVDGTARPQTVKKEINPKFYRLIKAFEEVTSVPVVLNTSFNVAGEPIVCRPEEALRTFSSCGLDYLAIGNFLIEK